MHIDDAFHDEFIPSALNWWEVLDAIPEDNPVVRDELPQSLDPSAGAQASKEGKIRLK